MRRKLTLLIVVCMLLSVVSPAAFAGDLPDPEVPAAGFSEEDIIVPFGDVNDLDYYYTAVAWAFMRGIAAGTSVTEFSPKETCTTAQILTFLYRAAGSPAVEPSDAFPELSPSAYYYNAALWAAENGMVAGSVFQGNSPCTRADVVTYLWILDGSPAMEAPSFSDVSDTASYASAVSWAKDCGITDGVSATTFAPDGICTRAQIVTFLYRAYKAGKLSSGEIPSYLTAPGHRTAWQHLGAEEQRLFDYIRQRIISAASFGGSVEIVIPETVFDYEIFSLTAEEVAELYDAENDSADKIFEKVLDSVKDVTDAVLVALECDEPGLYYWQRGGLRSIYVGEKRYSSINGAGVVKNTLRITYFVLPEYGENNVITKEGAERGAAQLSGAMEIVEKYASASDYEKLRGYLDEICALVDYQHDPAGIGYDRDLARVFDGDPSTGVVCVGYARAFDYLCSLTEFQSPTIKCMFIAGMVNDGPEYHAWNVVTMEDGNNYLIDPTFADAHDGLIYRYFLKGQSGGTLEAGYTVSYMPASGKRYTNGNEELTDMDCIRTYGRENLVLPSEDYPGVLADREMQEDAWTRCHAQLIDATPGVRPSEEAGNLFDGCEDTKWCVLMDGPAFVEWEEPEPTAVGSVLMTTGNDNSKYPGRNPMSWILYARNSLEEDWVRVWTAEKRDFMEDKDETSYLVMIGGSATYTYFRLEITETQGARNLQLSRFEIHND